MSGDYIVTALLSAGSNNEASRYDVNTSTGPGQSVEPVTPTPQPQTPPQTTLHWCIPMQGTQYVRTYPCEHSDNDNRDIEVSQTTFDLLCHRHKVNIALNPHDRHGGNGDPQTVPPNVWQRSTTSLEVRSPWPGPYASEMVQPGGGASKNSQIKIFIFHILTDGMKTHC